MQAFDRQQWLPVGFRSSGRDVIVRWMCVDPAVFVEPFFAHTLATQRTQAHPAAQRDTDVSLLLEAASCFPTAVPAGVIFHVSRCGSTLLTNVLRCGQNALALSEAPVVEHFLNGSWLSRSSLQVDELTHARRMLIGSVVTLYSYSNSAGPHKVVIKCVHIALSQLRSLREIWPQVPFVVLIRDPLEVMMSNLQKPAHWIRSKYHRLQNCTAFGISAPEAEKMSADEYCAHAIANLYTAAGNQIDDRCIVVDYEDLNLEMYQAVAKTFQIQLPEPNSPRLRQSISAYSKDKTGSRTFEDDRDLKQRAASPVIRSLAAEIAQPAYAHLRRRYPATLR